MDLELPFANDSPAPMRAKTSGIPPRLLHKTSFTAGPAPAAAFVPRSRKRTSKTQPVHIHSDSIDSLDEPFWPQDPPLLPPKHVEQRPSLADLTNSVGILAPTRGRLVHAKSTPALRVPRPRSEVSPAKSAIAPPRRAEERLDRAQVIASSLPVEDFRGQGDRRRDSAESLASLESLVDLIVGEKTEKEQPFTPSSPEVMRIVERQWTDLFAKDERAREKRKEVKEPVYEPVHASPYAPPAYQAPSPVREIRHTASTPALRIKPSMSTLSTRKEPKLLRSAASLAALRPVVSPANGEIAANGSARIVNDPTPLRRRQQTSMEVSIPPRSHMVNNFPPSPTVSGAKRQDAQIVSFPNAEEVAEKLNAAMRAKRRQKKWYHEWLAFGPTAAKAKEPVASGAKTALRGLLGETRPAISRAPSFELAPRITVSQG